MYNLINSSSSPSSSLRSASPLLCLLLLHVTIGHMGAFTNFILMSFRSFQIVSSSMVAFLAIPISALRSSEQLPVCFDGSKILERVYIVYSM